MAISQQKFKKEDNQKSEKKALAISPTIFGKSNATYEEAMSIALNLVLPAGKLEKLDLALQKNPAILQPTLCINGMKGALFELAIIRLDQNINKNPGMAEMLLAAHAKYFPDTLPEIIKRVELASSFDEKNSEKRKSKQLEVLNEAFNMIKEDKPSADKVVTDYIESTKPNIITNKSYYLGLVELQYQAFALFQKRGSELPRKKSDFVGEWYGSQGTRYCVEIIGRSIQSKLPDRFRQILLNSADCIWRSDKIFERVIDRDGNQFFYDSYTKGKLGVNFFYGHSEWGAKDYIEGGIGEVNFGMHRTPDLFKYYFDQLSQQPKLIEAPTAAPTLKAGV